MQCAHDHVARECGLDRDAARFKVSNFADHDDVGVLAQKGLERRGEGHADFCAYLHLIDAVEVVLDGIFGGHDVRVAGVDLGECRIQRRRLA